MSAVKFSRSSYIDNHFPESIHAWTKGTLYGLLKLHNIGPLALCPGGVKGQKLVNLKTCGIFASNISRSQYLDKHLSEIIQTWTIGVL